MMCYFSGCHIVVKMFPPTVCALLCLTAAAGVTGKSLKDYYILSWPERYTVSATRLSLISDIVEDYKAWWANGTSRVDYNGGAVKSIVKEFAPDYPNGVEYEIHPETEDGETSEMKCFKKDGDYTTVVVKSILPTLDDFIFIDHDPIDDKDAVKYFYKESSEGAEQRHTLWVDQNTDNLIPVRYELQEYNEWLGYMSKHEIWDFYDFKTEFDDEYFSPNISCLNNLLDAETVTKHLVFIDPSNNEHVEHVFTAFKNKYKREYVDEKEHAMRKSIFQRKIDLIRSTNRKNLGYKLTVNQFTDRTSEEMKRYQGLRPRPEGKTGNIPFPYSESTIKELAAELPDEYDLRLLGLVTAIKNQEDCGSCWTFGTTAAVEGALARVNGGKLISLSNQALVDCAWPFGASGCEGGSDDAAYAWMKEFGLPTEEEYGPYVNKDGYCHIGNMSVTYPIKGFTDVTPFSVGALKVAIINHGPLSVSLHVTDAFTAYSGGIFYDTTCTPTDLNHEVALVGYGQKDAETFWILKNSWGPFWGVDGYMLISTRDNNCGVATEPTYVTL